MGKPQSTVKTFPVDQFYTNEESVECEEDSGFVSCNEYPEYEKATSSADSLISAKLITYDSGVVIDQDDLVGMEIWWNSRKKHTYRMVVLFSVLYGDAPHIVCTHPSGKGLFHFPLKRVSKFGPLACKCLLTKETDASSFLIVGGSSIVNIDEETRRREKINDQEKFEKEQRERQENDKRKIDQQNLDHKHLMQLRDQSNQHQRAMEIIRKEATQQEHTQSSEHFAFAPDEIVQNVKNTLECDLISMVMRNLPNVSDYYSRLSLINKFTPVPILEKHEIEKYIRQVITRMIFWFNPNIPGMDIDLINCDLEVYFPVNHASELYNWKECDKSKIAMRTLVETKNHAISSIKQALMTMWRYRYKC